MPAKQLAADCSLWEARRDEPLLVTRGENDGLFDWIQTMVEGATSYQAVKAERYAPFARW